MNRNRQPLRPIPRVLPVWVITYEVWKDAALYREGTMRIPANTVQEARQGVEQVLHDLMPNLFPHAQVILTSDLEVEAP